MAALAVFGFAADGPTVLLPADSNLALKLSGAAGESARMTNAPVTGQPFKTVLRVEVTKKPERPTDVQLSTPIEAALSVGDVLMVSFYMRSAGSGEATLDAGFRTPPRRRTPRSHQPASCWTAAALARPSSGWICRRSPGRGGRGGFPGQPPLGAGALAGPTWKRSLSPSPLLAPTTKARASFSSLLASSRKPSKSAASNWWTTAQPGRSRSMETAPAKCFA